MSMNGWLAVIFCALVAIFLAMPGVWSGLLLALVGAAGVVILFLLCNFFLPFAWGVLVRVFRVFVRFADVAFPSGE
jgi:hypothetical protein